MNDLSSSSDLTLINVKAALQPVNIG